MTRPFSPAADRNKDVILTHLNEIFAHTGRILEIGSGTGQHAVHFAKALSHLVWHPTELPGNLEALKESISISGLGNLEHPIAFDVSD